MLRSTIFAVWLSLVFCKILFGSRGVALDLLLRLKCDSNGEDFERSNHVNMCRSSKEMFSTEVMVCGHHVCV